MLVSQLVLSEASRARFSTRAGVLTRHSCSTALSLTTRCPLSARITTALPTRQAPIASGHEDAFSKPVKSAMARSRVQATSSDMAWERSGRRARTFAAVPPRIILGACPAGVACPPMPRFPGPGIHAWCGHAQATFCAVRCNPHRAMGGVDRSGSVRSSWHVVCANYCMLARASVPRRSSAHCVHPTRG